MIAQALFAAAAFTAALGSTSTSGGPTSELTGRVTSAGGPIASSTVTLYMAGAENAAGETILGSATSESDGSFAILYAPPASPSAVLYAIAHGPDETTRLATVVGTAPYLSQVTIDERTTVATAYTMAQFIDGVAIGGNTPGVQNSAGTFRNLVNPKTASIGTVLGTSPNGTDTSTLPTFNSISNMLAQCVQSPASCAAFFDLATPPGGPTPTNTLEAVINIAHYSWQNAIELFLFSQVVTPYQPAMSLPPVTWTLALEYVGNGREFDGPGAIVFDEQGNAWINNNYVFKKNRSAPACASELLSKLTPTGQDFPGAPYDGKKAGLSGAGFGITLDPWGNVWVGNFGFFGTNCPCSIGPPANSVSVFTAAGEPISPKTGYTQGCVNAPQSTVSDQAGNIWMANQCGGTVTVYRNGDPDDSWTYDIATEMLLERDAPCPGFSGDGAKPFAIAIDGEGNGWISNNALALADQSVIKLSPDGALLATVSGDAINRPMGVATDIDGNVWIANSGIVSLPCVQCDSGGGAPEFGDLVPDFDGASLTKADSMGNVIGTYHGGGLWIPWGNAVDGDGDVWVANFGGFRLSHFRGTGEPVAPDGYHSDALQRITGVSIDPSGNVWLANNWITDVTLTNPGGVSVAVFLGLAAPVKTPVFGPPERP